jgi:hypothetical protein
MNYGDLKTRVAAELHRDDLTAEIPAFIETARQRIQVRFGYTLAQFTADGDENDVLDEHPDLYLFAATSAGYLWTHNAEASAHYGSEFERLANQILVTNPGSVLNPYKNEAGTSPLPPRITIYEES